MLSPPTSDGTADDGQPLKPAWLGETRLLHTAEPLNRDLALMPDLNRCQAERKEEHEGGCKREQKRGDIGRPMKRDSCDGPAIQRPERHGHEERPSERNEEPPRDPNANGGKRDCEHQPRGRTGNRWKHRRGPGRLRV